MATVALGAVGGAIGGSLISGTIAGIAVGSIIGQTIGGIAGSYIDQAFIFPAIFGRPDNSTTGPRLDDVRVQMASEGSAIITCFGPESRIAGTVIWCTDLVEHKKTQRSGGKGLGGGSTSTTYWYTVSLAIGLCHGEINAVKKIWADAKLIYDDGTDDDRYDSLTIYTGTSSQTADSVIEAEEGAGDVPGFRRLAYVVIENLKLADFGNRIPQFSFLVEEATTRTVADVLDSLLDLADIDSANYDTDSIDTGITVLGYSFSGVHETVKLIEPLLLAYDLTARDSGGVLYFEERLDATTITPAATQLAAYADGENNDVTPFVLSDMSNIVLPVEVAVRFLEPDRDYQAGLQRESRIGADSVETATYDLPLVLDADDARAIAKRLLWTAWSQRMEAEVSLPVEYVYVEESDLLALTYESEVYTVRVTTVERGANHLIRVTGIVEESQTATAAASADSPPTHTRTVDVLPTIALTLIDVGPLTDTDATQVGCYYAVVAQEAARRWRGAAVYRSMDDVTFDEASSTLQESTAGVCNTTLGDGPIGYWDRENTLRVTLYEGELESTDEINVLNGANHAYVGGEVIAFQTATLVSGTTYDLSVLLRGRRGTGGSVDGHGSNEAFVLLEAGSLNWLASSTARKDVTQYWKGVAVGQAEGDVSSFSQALALNSTKCFAPAHVAGSRDGSNNLTVTWTRVTRIPYRILSGEPAPMIEPSEEYLVEIMSGATVLRSITVTDAQTTTYTAAQQTTDGLTPGDPVDVRIKQVSQVYGNGREVEATV